MKHEFGPTELAEKIARVLYERERERGEHANFLLSDATGKVITGCAIEPWEECKDTFLSDARAIIEATSPAEWLPIDHRPLKTGRYIIAHRGHAEITHFFSPADSWVPGTKFGWQKDPASFGATHCMPLPPIER